MSTKINTNAVRVLEDSSKVQLKTNAKKIHSKQKPRITKQIRIEQGLHKKVKQNAAEHSLTMSKYLDKVVLFAINQHYPYK
jgi:predicted DNA binding CopG/RHH family protein